MNPTFAELPYKSQPLQKNLKNITYKISIKQPNYFWVFATTTVIVFILGTLFMFDILHVIPNTIIGAILLICSLATGFATIKTFTTTHKKILVATVDTEIEKVNNYIAEKYGIKPIQTEQLTKLLLGETISVSTQSSTYQTGLANGPYMKLINIDQPFESVATSPKANYLPPWKTPFKV